MPAIHRASIASACLLLAIGAALAIRHFTTSEAALQPARAPAVPATVAQVVARDVPVRIQAIGNVEPFTTVAIKARVDGQIIAVDFTEGAEVKKGQILFQIDPRPFEAQLQQAQANALRDQALLGHARDQERRNKELLEQKFISPDAYAQVKTNVETAAATVSADVAAMESVKLQLEYCTIRSPLTGYAGSITIQKGNLVKANDTVSLVVINQVQPILVSFAVPEDRLNEIRRYQSDGELQVSASAADAGRPAVAGRLSFINNSTDIATGTINLKAEFPNADKALWPGQFINVTLTLTTQKNAIVVPSTAIQNGPNGQYVYVVAPDQTVQLRGVTVARGEGADTVIASGLAIGETVVTAGQLRLAPGVRIAVDAKAQG